MLIFVDLPYVGCVNLTQSAAIFFGNLNGDQVYIFLHRIVGALPFTLPFTLAYHTFDPYNDARISQHTCDGTCARIDFKQQSFEHAKDPSQVHALALYYFARSEKIMNLHPFVEDVAPHLLTTCRNALGAQEEKIKCQAKQEAQHQILTDRPDASRKRKWNGPSSSLPTSSLSRNAFQSSQNIDGPRSLDGTPATSSSEQATWMRDRAEILSEKVSKVYNKIDDWRTLREQNLVKMQAVDALMPLIKQIDNAEERMKLAEKKLENLEKEKDDVVETYLQALYEIQKEER